MKKALRIVAVLLVAGSLGACSRRTETTHTEEEEGIAVTAWGDRYEIFAEADPLVVGQVSKSHTHVTILDGFPPLKEGTVSAILRGDQRAEQVFRQEHALRDGIFSIEIKPTQAGVFDLSFQVESPSGAETIRAGRVRVGEGDSLGRLVEPPHYGPPDRPPVDPPAGEPISFLKEQQWRTDFATAWAREGAVHRGVRGPARIRPAAGGEALLTAPLDGVVATTTWAFVGMDVARGATVVRLTPRVGSDRSLEQIRSEFELAQARSRRLEELLKLEAVSQAEVEEARARVKTLSAELRAVGGGGGSQVAVRSPLAGRIAEVLVVPGQAVAAGTPLARVVQTKPLWVEVALRPADAGALAQGITGLVLHPPGGQAPEVFRRGEVRLVSRAPEISRTTGSLAVILELRTDLPLRPGAAVEAEILLPQEARGIVLPSSALIDDGGVPVVYVQVEGESFIRQEIRVAASQGDSLVAEGLPEGSRVVTRGGAAIRRAALLRSGPPEGHVH
ncbi:MAG TPA: efflux RND transporter periplasmic adaptor subunit [Candidatus Limnocylindria bacterium]|nr:efflux RND transporter periplasmic adaptor subunit [Candidatus Limnocylindria bacterium]